MMKLVSIAALGIAVFANPASAAVIYDFSIASVNGDASGEFTAVSGYSATEFVVTGVTGTVNGATITGLVSYGGNDNQLYTTVPHADRDGIAFAAGGFDYNVFSTSGVTQLCVSTVEPGCTGTEANDAPSATFTLTTPGAVPEPATWAMMLVGFGMVGFAMRSRRKQNVCVTYA